VRHSLDRIAYNPTEGERRSAMFFYVILEALSDAGVIRRTVEGILKFTGWLTALFGLYTTIPVLKRAFDAQATVATLGGVIYAIVGVVTYVCIFQVFYYRSRSVGELGHSEYTAVRIMSVLCRLVGESWATSFLGAAVGLCLAFWLAGSRAGDIITDNAVIQLGIRGGWMGENPFLTGLGALTLCVLLSFFSLFFFYFLADVTLVLVDIERNTRRPVSSAGHAEVAYPSTRRPLPASPSAAQLPTTSAPPASASSQPPAPPETHRPCPPAARPHPPRCPACGARSEPGSSFCGECGSKL
jgi:hypothetical protein